MSTVCNHIDLHTHSTASDGSLTPSALVVRAAEGGVTMLALTDHDTIDGLHEARSAADAAGIQLIPGVEISVSWQRRTLHIVGLGIDPAGKALTQGLDRMQALRRERALTIAARLEKLGIPDAMASAEAASGGGQITRTHFARSLVASGHCSDMKQAFKRYLAAGKPAYVGGQWAELGEAIEWIHDAGGLAVLAHPLRYRMTAAWRRRTLGAFRMLGGDAVEVCCGGAQMADIQTSAAEAVEHGLMGSAGSDFHEPAQRWLRLGGLAPMPATVTPVWTRWEASGGV
jgi:predicted metal-dependent phosphoesterase TrpH